MTTYRFAITGLRHHDFANRLNELYDKAMGKRMSISIEHDNPGEMDAVIVYWGRCFVGYVRSGTDREKACSLILSSGRGSMFGKIVEVDRDHRVLWMEIVTDVEPQTVCLPSVCPFANWDYDDKILPLSQQEVQVHTMLNCLEMVIEAGEPWNSEMEEWLSAVEENLWCAISCETTQQIIRIIEMMTNAPNHPQYKAGKDRLQQALDHMGSPEVRRLQCQKIFANAESNDMLQLLCYYGDRAEDAVASLPSVFVMMFLRDGESAMGKLWYMHYPRKKIRAIMSLLAMKVHMMKNEKKPLERSIPQQWLANWTKEQHSEMATAVITKCVSDFELQHTSPQVYNELQSLQQATRPHIDYHVNTNTYIENQTIKQQ